MYSKLYTVRPIVLQEYCWNRQCACARHATCVCVCIYTCLWTCTWTHGKQLVIITYLQICLRVNMYMSTHIATCVCIYMYAFECEHTHARTYNNACMNLYFHICVCKWTCTWKHIYICWNINGNIQNMYTQIYIRFTYQKLEYTHKQRVYKKINEDLMEYSQRWISSTIFLHAMYVYVPVCIFVCRGNSVRPYRNTLESMHAREREGARMSTSMRGAWTMCVRLYLHVCMCGNPVPRI